MKANEFITQERVQQSIRARFNPLAMLTPQLLTSYLEAFRLGFFRNVAVTWDALERRDYKLQAVIAKRKKAVSRRGWDILTTEDSTAAQEQKRVLEYFYNHVTAVNVLEENETGGLGLLMRQMMDAVGKRYAVHEIVWNVKRLRVGELSVEGQNGSGFRVPSSGLGNRKGGPPKGGTPDRLMVDGGRVDGNKQPSTINPSLTATFRFCPLWWFEGTQGRLRFLPEEFALYGVDLEPGGWMVTTGDGLMEASSVAWVYKNLPLRDWLNYTEKFGLPGILAKTRAAKDSGEWKDLAETIKKFSSEWSAICSTENSIDLIQPRANGEGPFASLVEKMDRAITALWRGGDLGTLSSHNAAGASLQADEAAILEEDDAQMIGETLTAQVSRHVLEYHFGDAPQLAYIKIRTAERKDVNQSLAVDQFLLEAGAPLSVKDTMERYERAMPGEGEELLKALSTECAEVKTLNG